MTVTDLTEADRRLFDAFVPEVERAFAFLAEDGYRRDEARWPSVELRSPRARIGIALTPAPDGSHHFADVWLGAADHPADENRFTLRSLAAASGEPAESFERRHFPANDADEARDSLDRLAEALRTRFREYVRGEPDALARLEGLRERRVAELMLEQNLPDAADAFRAQDWQRVVDLLQPHEQYLGRGERRKLEYARERA